MPGFDRKGPSGEGPMTGRAMGRCTNKGEIPTDSVDQTSLQGKNANQNGQNGLGQRIGRGLGRMGRGLGRGLGLRRGRGAGFGGGSGQGRGMGRGQGTGNGQNI